MVSVPQEYEAEVPITAILKHPRNPRRGNLSRIEESIDENGFYGAIIVQRSTGYILVGNHRHEVLLEQNAPFVPVIWLDVDDETATRILLGDNRFQEIGSWDDDMLTNILKDVQANTGLRGTGYTDEDLYELIHGKKPSDKVKRLWVRIECESSERQDEILSDLIAQGYDAKASR